VFIRPPGGGVGGSDGKVGSGAIDCSPLLICRVSSSSSVSKAPGTDRGVY